MCRSVLTAQSSLLRAIVLDYRVDEEADKGKAAYISVLSLFEGQLHVQDEDAESNADSTCASSNSHKVHDQDAAPEASLEAIHCQKCCRFQRVAEEEDDCENIDE